MNGGHGEQRGKTHICDIEPKHITPNRLQDKIDRGFLHKSDIDDLGMGEIRHQLHPDSQEALEGNILDKNRQCSSRQSFSNHDMKGDLWIDLVLYLLFSHFGRVIGGETYSPIHHNDIILCLGEGPDFVYPRGLIPKGQV